MAIYWTNSNLTNPLQNSNSVFQFDTYPAVKGISNIASRNDGAFSSAAEYIFDSNRTNRNGASYDTATGRFTATRSGVYMVYVWLMSNNNAVYNNKNWRIRINNSGDNRQVYCYSSNVTANHTNMEASITVQLSVNDYVSVYNSNWSLYGSNERYSRFCVHYMG